MKKPYFYLKMIFVLVFMMMLKTSYSQEIDTHQQKNTEQTNSTDAIIGNSIATYGANGATGTDNNQFFPNPFMNDILTSTSPGSLFATSKSFNVDKSTGKVNVKVPIATVGPDGLKIPIALEYTTGGVKVRDVASWVGLGWNLSAGGKITRVMKRFPDKFDHSLDTLLDESTWKSRFWMANGEDNFDSRLENDDTQPDLFYFEIPGKSGLFAFDKDNKAHTIPYQNVKINYYISSETFEIIDEQGTSYFFEEMENTRIHKTDDIDDEEDINYKSLWYLSSAHNIKGESVYFEYKHLDNQRKYLSETKVNTLNVRYFKATNVKHLKTDFTDYETYVDPLYLKKISWNDGSVEFISTADRQDIPDKQAFKLNNIKLYSQENRGTLIKSYNFEYSTFSNNNNALKLDKITISAGNSGNSEFYRKFEYFPITGIGSNETVNENQIDHWGYYNGPGRRTGIPRTKIDDSPNANTFAGDDDRTPVLSYTLANSLKRVWVSSSGYDEFEYELNTRKFPDSPINKDSIENVGGLRIKSIKTKATELSNTTTKVRYEYADDSSASSGVVFETPKYFYLSSIENSAYCYTIMDSPIRPLFDLDGSHIRYGKVKEIFDNGSSNIYYFTTKKDNPDKGYKAYNIAKGRGIVTDTELAAKNMDLAPHTTQFWKRGLLTKKLSLDALGNETLLETFQYKTDTNVKGSSKGVFPFTDKMFVFIDSTIPGGVPGVDYPGNQNAKYIFEDIYVAEYEYVSQPIYMSKKTVKGIDIPETVTSYTYGNYDDAFLLKKETASSDGVTYSTNFTYPLDYANIKGTESGSAIEFMQNNNILSTPIEVVKYKNNEIIGGELYLYDKWHYMNNGSITGAMFNLREVKELSLKKSKLSTEFTPSYFKEIDGNYVFQYDSDYITKVSYEFNRSNKISCIRERSNPSVSIVYNSKRTLPTAQVSNAEPKILSGEYVEAAFHTSFEDNTGTVNTNAKTGSKVLTGDYFINSSDFVPDNYIVRYWASYNNGVDWELQEHEMEVIENQDRTFTIGGGIMIDELRVYPKGAMMNTRTYDDSGNITSETDENMVTTYYEYDAFGRLTAIRDNNRDLVKKYIYFIKNE